MSASSTIAGIIGLALSSLPGSWHELGAAQPAPSPASQQARPIDHETWGRKLAGLNEADWRTAFEIGQELAALPGDQGFAILKANWAKISNVDARQQLLKAWYFARPYPLHLRKHPRLLDGLDLGMRDPSPEVQQWAMRYLADIAFQDFAEDFQAYKAWYQANRDKPVPEVIAQSARRLAVEVAHSVKRDAPKRARWLAEHAGVFRNVPEARQAALDAGVMRTLGRWAAGAETESQREEIQLAAAALSAIGALKPGEAELRRVVVPLLAKGKPAQVRSTAISALGDKENAWAVDLILDAFKASLEEDGGRLRATTWPAASALASFDDPRVIPTMIAVIEADNTYDTVYGVGYFGLGRLTGVRYDESHDGAWWRRWWEKNKERYPEAVRALEIPKLSKKQELTARKPADPLSDVADVPAQDLRAGGDEKKRYFLIGAVGEAKESAAGRGLLIVLPGGDGSADFHPFIRRIYKNVLNERWLIAQAVAPKWDENQFNRVVWPTASLRYPAAKFTTEEFLQAIVADVRAKVKIDPRRVVLLGWSSGGPPCYATTLRPDSAVTGAFIAMSVFRSGQLPALEKAKGKAYYLLQSPEDRTTPMRFAEAAEQALKTAGAKVHLQRYEGGHGWRGDVWAMIRDGLEWLDNQVKTE
jgi:predicted esterase